MRTSRMFTAHGQAPREGAQAPTWSRPRRVYAVARASPRWGCSLAQSWSRVYDRACPQDGFAARRASLVGGRPPGSTSPAQPADVLVHASLSPPRLSSAHFCPCRSSVRQVFFIGVIARDRRHGGAPFRYCQPANNTYCHMGSCRTAHVWCA